MAVSAIAVILCAMVAWQVSTINARVQDLTRPTAVITKKKMQKYETLVTSDSGVVTNVVTERRRNADGSDEDIKVFKARHKEAIDEAATL